MSGIVVCEMCGDSWEVPDEAYPPDGRTVCDACEPDDSSEPDDDGEPDFTLDELEWQERYPELCGDDQDDDNELCPHCDGDGFGIVGVDWDEEDGVNGPFDGETERCPWCNGSGKAKDVTIW